VKLRTRFALFFAGAVAAALVFFCGAAALVLRQEERGSVEDAEEDVSQMLEAMLLAAPVAIAGAAGLGMWLSRRALAPMKEASDRARTARASELDLVLPVGVHGDEWDDLAQTLNLLLGEARTSLSRVRTFTADAAHELRTPLTTIMGEVDVTLRRERSKEELRDTLVLVREESARLAKVVDALLTLARADAGSLSQQKSPEPLEHLTRQAVSQALTTACAPDAHVEVRAADATVLCEPTLLQRALRNLIENGLIHGGGQVEVVVGAVDGMGRVLVRDQGPGIDAFRPQLFERFRRGEKARSGQGVGLGLALTRALVEAQGGTVRALAPPSGSEFEVLVPLAGS
jgi:two-component system heavy metal sensor histidine kinase CusS